MLAANAFRKALAASATASRPESITAPIWKKT
jgi:hypothetical protein